MAYFFRVCNSVKDYKHSRFYVATHGRLNKNDQNNHCHIKQHYNGLRLSAGNSLPYSCHIYTDLLHSKPKRHIANALGEVEWISWYLCCKFTVHSVATLNACFIWVIMYTTEPLGITRLLAALVNAKINNWWFSRACQPLSSWFPVYVLLWGAALVVTRVLFHRPLTEEPLLVHDVSSTSGTEPYPGTGLWQLVCYHPCVIYFELAQSKLSMSVMQLERLKTQMPLEQQSTSHTKNLYSTIPTYQKTRGEDH